MLVFKLLRNLGCWLLLPWFLVACESDIDKPSRFAVPEPANFPPLPDIFKNNPVTKEGFELGRALFYDPVLSRNNSVSCGSCHRQFAGFADLGHPVSHGIEDKLGTRNTPGLANLAWQPEFFWDGGVNHLELVPLAPLTNPVEMDETLANVINKLNKHPEYPQKFKKVFGQEQITSQQLFRAMAQFMGALVSADSRYDRYRRQEKEIFSATEEKGFKLFQQHCTSCHATDLLTDHTYRNNGLDATFTTDAGRSLITFLPADAGKFKVPSLRNVGVTAPYMHDGRFRNLAQVLEHYRNGVKSSTTLDATLIQPDGSLGIWLNDQEKEAIISFLHTLTDHKFLNNAAFSEPK